MREYVKRATLFNIFLYFFVCWFLPFLSQLTFYHIAGASIEPSNMFTSFSEL